jgi:hypothetical protein
MHQARAEEMRKIAAPNFQKIYEDVNKPYNDKRSRSNYMISLHCLISLVALAIILKFLLVK